jgi:hypothetical protein
MTETTHPLEVGALARITRDIAPTEFSEKLYKAGKEFIVEDYVSATDSEDGVPFYWGSSHKTGNMHDVVVVADAVELVKSSAEMAARTLPTPASIAKYLASEALGFGGDDFAFNEADYSAGDGSFEIYGRTTEGLPLGVTVKVIRVVQGDD